MFNHNRGLWGYTGTALDGAPLTVQSTGLGGPSAAIVLEELCDLGLARGDPDRDVPRARRRRRAGRDRRRARRAAADGASRALGAGEPLAGDDELTAALAPRTPTAAGRSSRATSSTTRARASAPSGRRPARSPSTSRRPRCSRSRAAAASAPPRCSPSTARGDERLDAEAIATRAAPGARPAGARGAPRWRRLTPAPRVPARRASPRRRGIEPGRALGFDSARRRRAGSRRPRLLAVGGVVERPLDRREALVEAERSPLTAAMRWSRRSTPSSMPSRRWETERTRRVRRSTSAAEGRLRAPIATSCAWAAFSRASNARVSAPLTSGFSRRSWASLPRASSPERAMRRRRPSSEESSAMGRNASAEPAIAHPLHRPDLTVNSNLSVAGSRT